jgi:hypothetical protein
MLENAGIAMQSNDENTRGKAAAMGIDNKGTLTEKVKNNRNEVNQTGAGMDLLGGIVAGVGGVIDFVGMYASDMLGMQSVGTYMADRMVNNFKVSGAQFSDLFTGGNQAKQDLITEGLKRDDKTLKSFMNLPKIPGVYGSEIAEASKVNDYLALSNGQAMSGAPGSAMALISELNANKYANSNTNNSQQTITVVVSGELEAKTKNGTQKINAKEFYDSDPVMMGEWIKRTMSQNSNGSANYIVDFGVAPI